MALVLQGLNCLASRCTGDTCCDTVQLTSLDKRENFPPTGLKRNHYKAQIEHKLQTFVRVKLFLS